MALSPDDFAQGGYRFNDLKRSGIVSSRSDLHDKQKRFGFPRPVKLGDRAAWFPAVEVHQWLAERAALRDADTGPAPQRRATKGETVAKT